MHLWLQADWINEEWSHPVNMFVSFWDNFLFTWLPNMYSPFVWYVMITPAPPKRLHAPFNTKLHILSCLQHASQPNILATNNYVLQISYNLLHHKESKFDNQSGLLAVLWWKHFKASLHVNTVYPCLLKLIHIWCS